MMETYKDINESSSAINAQNFLSQVQEDRPPPYSIPVKVEEPRSQIQRSTVAGQLVQRFFRGLFLAHLLLIFILVIVLTIRGLLSAHSHHFYPRKWYPPLLSAIASSGIVSYSWQWITWHSPSRAIKAAFWVSPLLTCAVGIVFVLIGIPSSLALGAISVLFALTQSLYACWVNPRLDYAARVLAVSIDHPPAPLVLLSIAASLVYSSFLVTGIGGATSTATGIDILFIFFILISLEWTMQVIKNTIHVTIARIRHLYFACGAEFDEGIAFRDTIEYQMGSVCIGSILVPIITVIRGSSRMLSLFAGGTDEFFFSCAHCYSAVASTLITYGNRWGFVQVGVLNKGFVQASMDTWTLLRDAGLETLIDTDLTGSFCFLCGVAGGAMCTLVAGIWELVIHKSYATEVSIYAFLIGYLMTRVAMAWPQSCVSAYYVAYAENPRSPRFDSTIPDRIRELLRNGDA